MHYAQIETEGMLACPEVGQGFHVYNWITETGKLVYFRDRTDLEKAYYNPKTGQRKMAQIETGLRLKVL